MKTTPLDASPGCGCTTTAARTADCHGAACAGPFPAKARGPEGAACRRKTAFAVWAVFNSLFSARKRRRGPNIALVVGKPPEKGDSDLAALSSSLLSRQRPGQAAASFPAERHAPCSRALRATRCACQQGASDARHGSRCRRCAARRHCPPGNDKDLETYFHVEKRGPFVIACPHATLRIARGPRAQASLIVRPKADGCR